MKPPSRNGVPAEPGRVADDLRSAFLVGPDEDLARRQLAAMLEAAATATAPAPPARPARPRLLVAALAGGLGLVLLGGGAVAAATGSLPDPVQDFVSSLVEPIGIDLPAGDEADEGEADGASEDGGGTADAGPAPEPGTPGGVGTGEDGVSGPRASDDAGEGTVAPGPAAGGSGDGTPPDPAGPPDDAPGRSGQAPGRSGDGGRPPASTPGNPDPGPPASTPGNPDPGPPNPPPGKTGDQPGPPSGTPGGQVPGQAQRTGAQSRP